MSFMQGGKCSSVVRVIDTCIFVWKLKPHYFCHLTNAISHSLIWVVFSAKHICLWKPHVTNVIQLCFFERKEKKRKTNVMNTKNWIDLILCDIYNDYRVCTTISSAMPGFYKFIEYGRNKSKTDCLLYCQYDCIKEADTCHISRFVFLCKSQASRMTLLYIHSNRCRCHIK